ncbi:MAG TPA: SRPBCC domain-containing protein [Chitinophagaceae bacterium]|nr:SRPBCC domain-containing protein [Chitinophagaceae bacterium]
MHATKNTRIIHAPLQKVYDAFTNPAALALWFAPGEMTAKVHNFNLQVGGGYEMSLFYPQSESENRGKTSDKEDRYTARFLELIPNKKIVEAIHFHSGDAALRGEMIMEILFEAIEESTKVTISFSNTPPGINPADNEKGTELTLEKLALYVA